MSLGGRDGVVSEGCRRFRGVRKSSSGFDLPWTFDVVRFGEEAPISPEFFDPCVQL